MTNNMIKVKLTSTSDVNDFVNVANRFDCDIDAIKGSKIIDAKSILGVSALDLSKPIYVQLHTNDEDIIGEYKKHIKLYIVEGV